MGVEVVGDLAHDRVERPGTGTENLVGDPPQMAEHVVAHGVRRIGGVAAPHHHGHATDLAVGHPAHVVLVVPGGEAGGLAQLAARPGRHAHCFYCRVRFTAVPGGTIAPGAGELWTTRPEPRPEMVPACNPAFCRAVSACWRLSP